jgi:hypothetical protein
MRITPLFAAVFAAALSIAPAFAEPPASLPKFVTDTSADTKAHIAAANVYALNNEMRGIYDKALTICKQNILAHSNLIMGLFTGKGGRFILYRAGQPPIEAPTPPMYEMAKSIGHAPMAVYEIAAPYVLDPKANRSWIAPMQSFRLRSQIARDSLGDMSLEPDQLALFQATLDKVIAFADATLKNGTFTYGQLEAFARDIETQEKDLTSLCAHVQVAHWFEVLTKWKAMLGDDWANTYGLTNSIYVTRQNNILFTVMAQFFGEEAINNRLLMLETTSFQTTPEDMLDVFAHIIADRTLSQVFFNHDRIMDSELLGWEGRDAVEEQMAKLNRKVLLPPLVPLNSNEWPWRTDPTKGSGAKSFDDLRSSGLIQK